MGKTKCGGMRGGCFHDNEPEQADISNSHWPPTQHALNVLIGSNDAYSSTNSGTSFGLQCCDTIYSVN
jgi:hypothetical protein